MNSWSEASTPETSTSVLNCCQDHSGLRLTLWQLPVSGQTWIHVTLEYYWFDRPSRSRRALTAFRLFGRSTKLGTLQRVKVSPDAWLTTIPKKGPIAPAGTSLNCYASPGHGTSSMVTVHLPLK